MHAVIAAEPVEAKVRAAKKGGRLTAHGAGAQFDEALKLSVISEAELQLWKRAQVLRHRVIMVDDFDKHFGLQAIEPATANADNKEIEPWQPKIAASM